MKRTLLVVLAVAALAFGMLPAAGRDVTQMLMHGGDRFVPKAPGTTEDLTFVFGPFVIPAGQDSNRYSIDVPFSNGFIVAVAPDLVDARSGAVPSEQDAHIHHAHWLRITTDATHEYYTEDLFLSWVFGTGEEKTQGRLDDRARVEQSLPGRANREYGIYIDGTTPQLLIYMIHNKTAAPLEVFVVLDVTFVHGTQTQLNYAGMDMHPLTGTLWGQTRDATPSAPYLSQAYTATATGTAVAAGGHTHPGGKAVIVTNQGPDLVNNANPTLGPDGVPDCNADADGDGFAGVTILNSWKYDRVYEGVVAGNSFNGSWPFSEDYQMGTAKFGWRAPIHAGDRIIQYAPHAVKPTDATNPINAINPLLNYASPDGLKHAHYQSMSYTGLYVDRAQLPAPISGGLCNRANYEPTLIGADDFPTQGLSGAFGTDPRIADIAPRYRSGAAEGMLNHLWLGDPDNHCGVPGYAACEAQPGRADPQWSTERVDTDVVHVGAFVYAPGDLGSSLPIPRVRTGTPLTFVNEDAALNIRHTITSCLNLCNGPYTANYPVPDGFFDSGKLGNFDPIDGGLFTTVDHQNAEPEDYLASDTIPFWKTPADLAPGLYSYFCRIHPWMRGAFQVTA